MLGLLTIGEAMAELRQAPTGGFVVGFAGDTFNTAVYGARQMGASGRVGFHTRVGADPLSAAFKEFAGRHDIQCSYDAESADRNLGIYSVTTDAGGERRFHYWRDRSAARTLFDGPDATISMPSAKVTFLSGITLAILSQDGRARIIDHLEQQKRDRNCLIGFDSNFRPALWEDRTTAQSTIAKMWAIADIALPSIDDEMTLFGEDEDQVIARFTSRMWAACAIKRGARGPVSPSLPKDATPVFRPATQVVDTTAAGDTFNGAYLAAFLKGQDERACLLAGHELAAKTVSRPGAIVDV